MNRYLRIVHIDRYGGQENREVGPFGPGLNVVYGPNEAGKTTVASFVRGVLFGWEEARGVRNRYLPAEGGRSGELVWRSLGQGADPDVKDARRASFASDAGGLAVVDPATGVTDVGDGADTTSEEEAEVRLFRNESAAVGGQSVLADIDRETFDALFSLTSDELRSLHSSPDVTARLLTAGSGTASDPSSAFLELERRIASTPVYELSAALDEKRDQVKAAVEQERLHIQEDRELREIRERRAATAEQVAMLDEELEKLRNARADLAAAEKRAEVLSKDVERLRGELADTIAIPPEGVVLSPKLLALDSAGDRVLRDQLDELAEEQEKVNRALDTAKENSATSVAAYEALCEMNEEEVAAQRRLRNRPGQMLIAVLLPLVFVAAGVPLFLHGRDINSLSITALGVSLVVVAVFLAAAAFFALFRKPQASEQLDARRKDAQWVMLQDRKKLDACLADRDALTERVGKTLADAGLEQAGGSIRQARSLLDEARAARAVKNEESQRKLSLELRMSAAERELDEIAESREQIAASLGLQGPAQGAALDSLVREKVRQRDALVEAANDMIERFGELSHKLALARTSRASDQLKLEYQQIRVRLREAKQELIMLLIARRTLERSIVTWENQGQPEIYARAGALLTIITDGAWVGVSSSRTGSLVAVSADGTTRDPRHLSLGTCQQLYLALRLSLLMTAENVGRSIPVLADDILVNFDAERRRGAARVLAELARQRQVVVFTCHLETVAILRDADPAAVFIDL